MTKKLDAARSLFRLGEQRTFTGDHLNMIAFPLGGIGTGSVSLSGRGGLIDWEIFNRPNLGGGLPKTFPIIWAREQGQAPVCRVLMAPPAPPYQGAGGGDPHWSGEGFPHMDSCTFQGAYPIATIDFACKKLPVEVSLKAYNPFIPCHADDSGFPAAVLHYTVKNRTRKPVDVSVAWSVLNLIGTLGVSEKDCVMNHLEHGYGQNVNTRVDEGGVRGVLFSSRKYAADHPRFGTVALTTPHRSVSVLTYWLRANWFTPVHDFWDTFSATGTFKDREYPPSDDKLTDAGALALRAKLKPGESKTLTFYLTWHFPNFEKYWHDNFKPGPKPVWKNYYAAHFSSALDAAQQLHRREPQLRALTQRFHDALFSSTVPPSVLDAASSQMGILKTATCLRLPDGTFYGFEGCAPMAGCCEGTCTHVWNYQQTLPFLFPSLERSMRSADYEYMQSDNGHMCFRMQLPLGAPPTDFHACADGQLGGVIKFYRDWKISGDDAWARGLWPRVKKALEYAWVQWDPDQSGVIKGVQHNTYDIEFLGPNAMLGSFYLAALCAGAEMAEHLGEPDTAREYRAIYEKGRAWMDAHLFNGEYYIQKYDPKKAPVHQFGKGCLADQLLGQCMATLTGMGYVLDPGHIRTTLKSIFRYNYKSDLTEHANAQRVYAINDEAGLILCSWPHGGRPAVPFPYSDEVWTGIEYQVATHLILEGLIAEGLTVVKAARDRFDGLRRNPWNEFECGSHYARAMAAYGLLPALAGFTYDLRSGLIGFDPKLTPNRFKTFWALDGCWGTYAQHGSTATLEVDYGQLTLRQLELAAFAKQKSVHVQRGDGKAAAAPVLRGTIALPVPLTLRAGSKIVITR